MRVSEDVVAIAARRTREAGTARVWGSSFNAEPIPRQRLRDAWLRTAHALGDAGMLTERYGVADLVARRAHVHERNAFVEALTADILARWPWLVEEDEADEDIDPWSEVVQLGSMRQSRIGERWMGGGPGTWAQGYCAWILDGLTAVRR